VLLERRLRAVRKGQEGLKTHIGELNMAISGAGASLRALKAAAGEAAQTLDERLKRARLHIDELSVLTASGERIAQRMESVAAAPRVAREIPDMPLPWGSFGENLTTHGMLEDEVWIGDRYRVGSMELVVTQPRMPCYKLAIRFGDPDMVRRFLQSGRSGFYFSVAREGEVGAGDAIERLARDAARLTVADVVALYATDRHNKALMENASTHPSLPAAWRGYFRKRLGMPDA